MWIRFRGRNGHLILVELTNAGVLIHGWSLSPTVLHGWTEINDVTIGQDQQGEPNVQLHLGPETISLPQKLRIDRTEADIDEVMGHIQDFRQRYGPR